MPRRMIDGDAIWTSTKLLSVAEELRVEYAWVLPSADANGCCEYNPALIYRNCYAMLRDGWTPAKVASLFDTLEAAKMVYRFEHDGKTYAFFVGMEREGRLPKPSERSRYKNSCSIVPADGLAAFLGTDAEIVSRQYRDVVAGGSPLGNGNGTGTGIGLGKGEGKAHNALPAETKPPQDILSTNSLQHNEHNGNDKTGGLPKAAVPADAENDPAEPDSEDDAEWLAKVFRAVVDANPHADASRIPKNWKTVWAEDFRTMLEIEGCHAKGAPILNAVLEYICYSQTPAQQKYFRRPAMLVDKHVTVLYNGVQKLKKVKAWEPIWQRFLAQPQLRPLITIDEPAGTEDGEQIASNDEAKTSAVNIEDEDKELA